MKRFAFSVLTLLCLSPLAGANGTCAGRRGLVPQQQQFFRAPSYAYSQGCYGCYGGQPQQAPVPAPAPVCDTCQQPQQSFAPQYQPQYDVAPTCAPQQALYAPQASYSPGYAQRAFAPPYGVGASFASSYGVGAAVAPGYAVAPVVVRQRFFAPRFLGPPVRRFPGHFPRAFGVGAGFAPGFATVPAFGGGGGFFFRGRNFSFGRFF